MRKSNTIKLPSDPMWDARGCATCGTMTFIAHVVSGEFETYLCSCEKKQIEAEELFYELYWETIYAEASAEAPEVF